MSTWSTAADARGFRRRRVALGGRYRTQEDDGELPDGEDGEDRARILCIQEHLGVLCS